MGDERTRRGPSQQADARGGVELTAVGVRFGRRRRLAASHSVLPRPHPCVHVSSEMQMMMMAWWDVTRTVREREREQEHAQLHEKAAQPHQGTQLLARHHA